jgi:replication-associated recombination protein RarA
MIHNDIRTKQGYDFYEVTSSLQKAVRRNDPATAGFFALELYHSGYWKYVWKRLFVISAEDCAGLITQEIEALFKAFLLVNEGKPFEKGRIFISKAVLLLCEAKKCRDSDHLQNFIYDRHKIDDKTVQEYLKSVTEVERLAIPTYAHDVHTARGRALGKNKTDFFEDELHALNPRKTGLFDSVIE